MPITAPILDDEQSYSAEHESLASELIAWASHTHPLFHDDTAEHYHFLEEATRGSVYADSIKPIQRLKNG